MSANYSISLFSKLGMQTLHAILYRLTPIWDAEIDQRSSVCIDLTDVSFIRPSVITVLATTILRLRQQGCQITIEPPISNDVDDYLTRIDFYELAGIDTDYPWQRHDASGRFREVVRVQSEDEIDQIVTEVLEILDQNEVGIETVSDAARYAFVEIVSNVFHHAQSPTGAIVCAQSYRQSQQVELAVVDFGRGIPASLNDNPQWVGQFTTAAEAIDLAVHPRVTGRPDHNTGEGLFFTLEFIKENGGNACVHSQDGSLWVRGGHFQTEPAPIWPGTIVALEFHAEQPIDVRAIFNRYAPPEHDYEWLLPEDTDEDLDWLFDDEIPF